MHHAPASSRVSLIMGNPGNKLRHVKLRDGDEEAEIAALIAYNRQCSSQY